MERFDRQIRLFGKDGQKLIGDAKIAIVGLGGLGSHIVQQMAFLGVGNISLIEVKDLDESNMNRLIGAQHTDTIPGTKKIAIAERLVNSINDKIKVTCVDGNLYTEKAFARLKQATHIFGCVDNDLARHVLNEFCLAYNIPLIDLATDVDSGIYGGRIFSSWWKKAGCLICLDLLDSVDILEDSLSKTTKKNMDQIYGISPDNLEERGPSVVTINGVVASLAATEFMVGVTGLREAKRILVYDGSQGRIVMNIDSPRKNCYYCNSIKGKADAVNIERYIAELND